jgi:hypothetical protein
VKNRQQPYVPEEGYIDGERTNRGNKLKVGATLVHRDRLDGYNNDIESVETVDYNRARRTVYKRRRFHAYSFEDPEYEGDEDDPYLDIDIQEVLKPISHPSELSNRECISKTYTSKILQHYANQSIEVIEKEQETVCKLAALLDFFLGEDEQDLLEAGLDLPEYDHNLVSQPNSNDANTTTEEVDLDKRVTRNSTSQEADAFFALPRFKFDPDQGLPPSVAEEARQLSQLALQRTEGFIRSLRSVRNGLIRAQMVKEKLYAWGREMNNDPDESDIYVAEKEAAAKAAIAEKEAKAALEQSTSESSSSKATPQPTGRRRGRRS